MLRWITCLLLLLLAPSIALAGSALGDARKALDARQYDRAADLALEVLAAQPGDSEALSVLGLARFRTRRFAEAVQAFDAAGRAAVGSTRPLIAYNRGSALYELGRYDEAERAFVDAAGGDADLAPLAMLNAGYAARDAGDDARARRHADRAAALPGGEKIADMVADLRADLEAGAAGSSTPDATVTETMAAGTAATAVEQAARGRQPPPGEAGADRLDDAIDLMRAGDRAEARKGFEEAMSLGLDTQDRETAIDYLDALTPGLRSRGRGPEIRAVTGGGFDSNVSQSGTARPDSNSYEARPGGSGFASATLELALRLPLGGSGFSELAYGFDQLAYLTPDFDDFSVQEHVFSATGEVRVAGPVRASLALEGVVLFTGLEKFAGFQWGATATPEIAIDEGERATTRLAVGRGRKSALAQAYKYYDGTRTDVTLSQDVRVGRGTLGATFRNRHEKIGTDHVDLGRIPLRACPDGCIGTYVVPYAYRGNALDLSWQSRVGRLFRLGAYAGLEGRRYDDESYLKLTTPVGTTRNANRRRRKDARATGGLAAGVLFGSAFEATLRWDLVANGSNVDNTKMEPCTLPDLVCHQLDYDNKNYRKHLITLDVSGVW